MIAAAEESLTAGLMTKGSSHLSVIVRQSINELESPSFTYTPLFGLETALQVRMVMTAAARAKANLKYSTRVEPVEKKEQRWWPWLIDILTYSAPTSSDENGEEAKKAINHLESASAQLAAFFDVSVGCWIARFQSARRFNRIFLP